MTDPPEPPKPGTRPRPHGRGARGWLFGLLIALLALVAAEWLAAVLTDQLGSDSLRQTMAQYRAMADGHRSRYVPAPYLNYRLQAGFLSKERNRQTRHNRAGFRDDFEYTPKPPETLRIICLGGSTTYGAGVADNRDTYPAQLQRALERGPLPAGIRRVEVMNMGVGGYTSAEVLAALHFKALPLSPDLVLVQSAINDVIPRTYDEYDPAYEGFRIAMRPVEPLGASWLLYRSSLYLVVAIQLGWIQPLTLQSQTQRPESPASQALINLERHPPVPYRRNLTAIVTLARAAGTEPWLLTQSYNPDPALLPAGEAVQQREKAYRAGQTEHNAIMRELSAEQAIGMIDLAESIPPNPIYFTDSIHMTAEGNRIKAQQVADALRAHWAAEVAEQNPIVP